MRSPRTLAGALTLSLSLVLACPARAGQVPVKNAQELTAAIAAAKPGDVIVLASGTYDLTGVECSAAATPAAPIVVRAESPLAAKIRFNALEGFKVSGASWHFEDLDITGVCPNDADCEHAFHVFGKADGFTLSRNRIVDFNAQLKVNALQVGGIWTTPNLGVVVGNEVFDTRARNTTTPVTKLNIDTGDGWIVRANYVHDFHKVSNEPTYGAFMKSGGKNGVFERNLVACTKDYTTAGGVFIGLSFGGGGTGNQYCAPAFDPNVPCDVEHQDGTMRNNVIVNCTDVGIYVNRGKGTKLYFNTLIGTSGIDYRFATTTGDARGNVLSSAIRARDGATFTQSDNLVGLTAQDFVGFYQDALAGDLRLKGSVAALIGKAPHFAEVTDDYCARPRGAGVYDLGALEHSLGDCDTRRPPIGGGGGGDAGASGDGGGGGGDASLTADSAGGGRDDGGGNGASPPASPSGCSCRATTSGNDAGALAALLAAALAGARFRRRGRGAR